jgi:phosphosulfolactate phosphohydrolase-like enzyme
MEQLKRIAKQCLSIVDTSNLKDDEIEMLINSAKKDLERVNIEVEKNIEDNLIINTIMLYVKAHFGDTDIEKRKEYLNRYKSNLRELQFSEEYQKEELDSNA